MVAVVAVVAVFGQVAVASTYVSGRCSLQGVASRVVSSLQGVASQ